MLGKFSFVRSRFCSYLDQYTGFLRIFNVSVTRKNIVFMEKKVYCFHSVSVGLLMIWGQSSLPALLSQKFCRCDGPLFETFFRIKVSDLVPCSRILMDQKCQKMLLVLKNLDIQVYISSTLFISFFSSRCQ